MGLTGDGFYVTERSVSAVDVRCLQLAGIASNKDKTGNMHVSAIPIAASGEKNPP